MIIRPADSSDDDAIWSILEPTIRTAETYTLPQDMDREQALAYWFSSGHTVFVAEEGGEVLGTYYLRANQRGGGSHVGNCGYMTAAMASGRGVATAMCAHSLEYATIRGLPRHAIQLCRQQQPFGDSSLAEVRLCDGWPPSWRVPAPKSRVCGRPGDVSHAVREHGFRSTELPRLQ